MEKNKIWNIWGKISLILTIIITLISIYSSINKDRVKIKASIEYFEIEPTNDLSELIRKNKELTSNDNLTRLIQYYIKDKLTNEEIETLAEELSIQLHFTWTLQDNSFDPETGLPSNYIYKLKLENESNITAKEIRITTDNIFGSYRIKYYNNIIQEGSFHNVITVGDIRAHENVEIIIWTVFFPKNNMEFKYSHETGSGRINNIYKYNYNLREIILYIIILCIFITTMILLYIYLYRNNINDRMK